MIGYEVQCKYPYSYNSLGKQLDKAYKTIQLIEPHEAGEILDNYWMICNESWYEEGIEEKIKEIIGKFEAEYYVKGVDIRYFDIFATDINYDHRKDLRKLGTKVVKKGNKYIGTVNLYRYIGTDYPEVFY